MSLDTVQRIAEESGMPSAGLALEQELKAMLDFFHSLNVVLWYDTPSLRDLVVLDLQWIIDAVTCFIRDFDNDDPTEWFLLGSGYLAILVIGGVSIWNHFS